MSGKAEGLNFNGTLTGTIHNRLATEFHTKHGDLSRANDEISATDKTVAQRYNELYKGKVDPVPDQSTLEAEYQKSHAIYQKHKGKSAEYAQTAARLQDDIRNGLLEFQKTGLPADEATQDAAIKGYASVDPTLHQTLKETHNTFLTQMRALQNWQAAVTKTSSELNANLVQLNSNLCLFRGIIRTDGKPASFIDPKALFTAGKAYGRSLLGWEAAPIKSTTAEKPGAEAGTAQPPSDASSSIPANHSTLIDQQQEKPNSSTNSDTSGGNLDEPRQPATSPHALITGNNSSPGPVVKLHPPFQEFPSAPGQSNATATPSVSSAAPANSNQNGVPVSKTDDQKKTA